jgi:hypothetical protein
MKEKRREREKSEKPKGAINPEIAAHFLFTLLMKIFAPYPFTFPPWRGRAGRPPQASPV